MRVWSAIAGAGLIVLIGGAAAERPEPIQSQINSAESARSIIADKIAPRVAESRARLLALYRSSSVTRSIFDPENRWRRSRARTDLVRVLRRDLDELEALKTELTWVEQAATELGHGVEQQPRPILLRPVVGAAVVNGFGPYRAARRVRSVRTGVVLGTTPEASIRAPVAGRIVYSGQVAGLGQAAVIESEGYWITMGPLALALPLGSEVERGAAIGRTLDAPMFLELRQIDSRGGAPIDPRPLTD